jgi:hypothetical protein
MEADHARGLCPHSSLVRTFMPPAQRGAALLAILLVVLAAASSSMLSALRSGSLRVERETLTTAVLGEAKLALLAYSANYPERHGGQGTPGLLPCPDLNANGSAAGNCSLAGGTTAGRFPWRTVRTGELRDHEGELLWYAVADRFRTPQRDRLHSDTPGDLAVDGVNDVVAVIFAPGGPVGSQDRVAGPLARHNYLEGRNASAFTRFTSRAAGNDEFNDRLVMITRAELMRTVEQRVLGDVARTLSVYRGAYGVLPWLSPFADPSLSEFRSQDAMRRGHLPFHWSGDVPGVTPRNPFRTAVRWTWRIDPGTAAGHFAGTVGPACLRRVDCADDLFPRIQALHADARCVWTDRNQVDCQSPEWVKAAEAPCDRGCSGKCIREYRIAFPPFRGEPTINPPTAAAARTRSIALSGAVPAASHAVEIRDHFEGPLDPPACGAGGRIPIGAGYMNFTTATRGEIQVAGIRYDLDVDAGELPAWFVRNDWHHLLQVAYAPGELMPGHVDEACSPDPGQPLHPCLALSGRGLPADNKRAIVLIAGPALRGVAGTGTAGIGQARPSAHLSDYFESGNAGMADRYHAGPLSADFNDQVRIIAEAVP